MAFFVFLIKKVLGSLLCCLFVSTPQAFLGSYKENSRLDNGEFLLHQISHTAFNIAFQQRSFK